MRLCLRFAGCCKFAHDAGGGIGLNCLEGLCVLDLIYQVCFVKVGWFVVFVYWI